MIKDKKVQKFMNRLLGLGLNRYIFRNMYVLKMGGFVTAFLVSQIQFIQRIISVFILVWLLCA